MENTRNWKPYEDALLRAFVDKWKRENLTTTGKERKTLNRHHWKEISEALKEAGITRTPKACACRVGRNPDLKIVPDTHTESCSHCKKEPVTIVRHYSLGGPESTIEFSVCSEKCMEDTLSLREGDGPHFTQMRRVMRGRKVVGYARQPNPKKRTIYEHDHTFLIGKIKRLEAKLGSCNAEVARLERNFKAIPTGLLRQKDLPELSLGVQYIVEVVDETRSGEKLFTVQASEPFTSRVGKKK